MSASISAPLSSEVEPARIAARALDAVEASGDELVAVLGERGP